ncbi:hypothetical protein [Streptomyces sp. NPDC088725]|uniref:hypothetical protein n=1 Tax=Streptomyces sp. NPDC088725 TaxID=3365873 RepID=UPI0038219219
MFAVRSRRPVTGLTAAAAAVLAAAGFVLPRAVAPADTDETKVVTWVAEKEADTEPHHVRLGDQWVTYLRLHESHGGRAGRVIGDGSARCGAVAVTARGAITQCQRVLRAHDGTLALSGMIDRFGPGPYVGRSAVVGGTGVYEGAGGQAEITLDGDHVRFRVHLDD